MSTSETILPWKIARELRIEVERPVHAANGLTVESVTYEQAPDFGPPVIDLAESEAWQRIRVPVVLTADNSVLAGVLAAGEDIGSYLKCVVVLQCHATKTRRAVEMTYSKGGKWAGEIDFARSELAATATIKARITRSKPAKVPVQGIAHLRGSLVGESDETIIVVDRWARPYNGPIRWSWVHFSKHDDAYIRSRSGDLFYVDTTSAPTVLLNLDHENLQAVLEGKERSGPSALLRVATAAGIANAVWTQLVLASLQHAKPDEESGDVVVPPDWRGAIVKSVLPIMYPEYDAKTSLSKVVEAREDDAQTDMLLARVAAAAQQLSNTGREFVSAASIAKRMKGGEQ